MIHSSDTPARYQIENPLSNMLRLSGYHIHTLIKLKTRWGLRKLSYREAITFPTPTHSLTLTGS